MIKMVRNATRTKTSLIQIYNFILAMTVLDMMMEMTSKIIIKKKMNMEKSKLMVEMCLKIKGLITQCL